MMCSPDHFITVEKFTQTVKPTSWFFKCSQISHYQWHMHTHLLLPYFFLLLDEPEIDGTVCLLLANSK